MMICKIGLKRRLIPFGMSGLKSQYERKEVTNLGSHPVWDEWIEIKNRLVACHLCSCLIPFGMSGLKSVVCSFYYEPPYVSSRLG